MSYQLITAGAAERFIEQVRAILAKSNTFSGTQAIDDAFHVAGLHLDGGTVLVVEPKPDEAVGELIVRLGQAHHQLAHYFNYGYGTCACGARAESLGTHPHVGGCETAAALDAKTTR